MSYYQMTLEEYIEPERQYRPRRIIQQNRGLIDYECPVCGRPVGIYSTGTVHERGWLIKEDTCRNGHSIKWP